MLKKAAPLQQDLGNSTSLKTCSLDPNQNMGQQGTQPSASVASSGLVSPKTTADALEELRGYRVMKNLLLKQGGKSPTKPS